jgi:hypothetical protein
MPKKQGCAWQNNIEQIRGRVAGVRSSRRRRAQKIFRIFREKNAG